MGYISVASLVLVASLL